MDSFDNFQYDSASSYGGLGVADDTSSVYTAITQDGVSSVDLSNISLSEYNGPSSVDHEPNLHQHPQGRNGDEDFDAVLDDLKDDGVLDLPPHACRYVAIFLKRIQTKDFISVKFLVIVAYIHQPRLSSALSAPSGFATLEAIHRLRIS
jgi:hypothetical protein